MQAREATKMSALTIFFVSFLQLLAAVVLTAFLVVNVTFLLSGDFREVLRVQFLISRGREHLTAGGGKALLVQFLGIFVYFLDGLNLLLSLLVLLFGLLLFFWS